MIQCQYCGEVFPDDCTGGALKDHAPGECTQRQIKTLIDMLQTGDRIRLTNGETYSRFQECPMCASKPGTPTLCSACVRNRAAIVSLGDRNVALSRQVKAAIQEKSDAIARAEEAERQLCTERDRIAALNDIHVKTVAALRAAVVKAQAKPEGAGPGIYVASKSQHGKMWRAMRASGLPIISTWIDESDPGQTTSWSALYERAVLEASTCSALVLYVPDGDVPKGGCLIETGAALAAGRKVFAFAPAIPAKLLSHPLIKHCESLEQAIQEATRSHDPGVGQQKASDRHSSEGQLPKPSFWITGQSLGAIHERRDRGEFSTGITAYTQPIATTLEMGGSVAVFLHPPSTPQPSSGAAEWLHGKRAGDWELQHSAGKWRGYVLDHGGTGWFESPADALICTAQLMGWPGADDTAAQKRIAELEKQVAAFLALLEMKQADVYRKHDEAQEALSDEQIALLKLDVAEKRIRELEQALAARDAELETAKDERNHHIARGQTLAQERDAALKKADRAEHLLGNVFDRDDGPDLDAYLDGHVGAPSLSRLTSERDQVESCVADVVAMEKQRSEVAEKVNEAWERNLVLERETQDLIGQLRSIRDLCKDAAAMPDHAKSTVFEIVQEQLALLQTDADAGKQAAFKCCTRNAWGDGEHDAGCPKAALERERDTALASLAERTAERDEARADEAKWRADSKTHAEMAMRESEAVRTLALRLRLHEAFVAAFDAHEKLPTKRTFDALMAARAAIGGQGETAQEPQPTQDGMCRTACSYFRIGHTADCPKHCPALSRVSRLPAEQPPPAKGRETPLPAALLDVLKDPRIELPGEREVVSKILERAIYTKVQPPATTSRIVEPAKGCEAPVDGRTCGECALRHKRLQICDCKGSRHDGMVRLNNDAACERWDAGKEAT